MISSLTSLKNIKRAYKIFKKMGVDHELEFLNSIVSHCKYTKYNKEDTLKMIALIKNFIPEPGQSFRDCDVPGESDFEFTEKVKKEFDEIL